MQTHNDAILIDFFLDWPKVDDASIVQMLHQTSFRMHVVGSKQYDGNIAGVFIPKTLEALNDFASTADIILLAGRHHINNIAFEDIIDCLDDSRSMVGIMGHHPTRSCLVQSAETSHEIEIGCCHTLPKLYPKRDRAVVLMGDLFDDVVIAASAACMKLGYTLHIVGELKFSTAVEAIIHGPIAHNRRIELLSKAKYCLMIKKTKFDDETVAIEPLVCGTPVGAVSCGSTKLDKYYIDGVTGRLWQLQEISTDVVMQLIKAIPAEVGPKMLREMSVALYSPDVYLNRIVDSLG